MDKFENTIICMRMIGENKNKYIKIYRNIERKKRVLKGVRNKNNIIKFPFYNKNQHLLKISCMFLMF